MDMKQQLEIQALYNRQAEDDAPAPKPRKKPVVAAKAAEK
jgi:hypothetical protein